LSRTIPNYLTLKNIAAMECRLNVTQKILEMAPFARSRTNYYWHSTVAMALRYVVSKIKRDTGQKSRFFHTPSAFDTSVNFRRNFAVMFCTENILVGTSRRWKSWRTRFGTIHERDRQTDRHRTTT